MVHATSWQCGSTVVSLESPILVGILNTTPDSFSDGGDFMETQAATRHAMQMVKGGATMIDVGGESTRPGASRVNAEEQIARVVPVIEAIRAEMDVIVSIDTTLVAVAKEAIGAGATVVNDVSSGMEDPDILHLVAQSGVGLVLMHRRLPPAQDKYSDQYDEEPTSDDIVQEVCDWLCSRVSEAESIGVRPESIALDPGLGFGKSVDQNWELVAGIGTMVDMGYPIYVGASRKSFIGAKTGLDNPALRDEASVAVAIEMAEQGAQIFRIHNVHQHARVLQSPARIHNKDRS